MTFANIVNMLVISTIVYIQFCCLTDCTTCFLNIFNCHKQHQSGRRYSGIFRLKQYRFLGRRTSLFPIELKPFTVFVIGLLPFYPHSGFVSAAYNSVFCRKLQTYKALLVFANSGYHLLVCTHSRLLKTSFLHIVFDFCKLASIFQFHSHTIY